MVSQHLLESCSICIFHLLQKPIIRPEELEQSNRNRKLVARQRVKHEMVKTYRCSAALSCSLTPSHLPSQVGSNKGHRASSVRTAALVYVWLQFTAPQSDRTEEPQPRPPEACPRAQASGERSGKAGGVDERHYR